MERRFVALGSVLSVALSLLVGLAAPEALAAEWSVGIFEGSSPLSIAPVPGTPNPVLSANIIGIQTDTVADPFVLVSNGTWYLFVEVVNPQTGQGDIGYATSSDGLTWTYRGIVLDQAYHLSYPHVFAWNGSYYMVPETNQASSIQLYRASSFPTSWQFVATLVSGKRYVDPSPFFYNNVWWMFASDTGNSTLYLFYADSLTGPWTEHPLSPLVTGNANISRPGGRVLQFDGRLIRVAQDDSPTYGNAVRLFGITTLTKTAYAEYELPESPLLSATGSGWNADGMHQLDAVQLPSGRWRAVADGLGLPGAPNAPAPISQSGWSLRYVDSQELVGENGAAANAFDGKTNTFWHTEWKLTTAPQPHEIQINLGANYRIEGFRALARQDGGDNGRIRQYEFYVSADGVNWGSPVATASLADTEFEQEVQFSAVTGAFVRLKSLSAYDGDPWTSLAELKVLGAPASTTLSPISQAGWSLRYADSQELVGENGAATNAFDGKTGTFWHTEWKLATAPQPHELQINLGASYQVGGFRALARQDGGDNGRIQQFQFYVSTDGINWGSAVATGNLADNASEQEVLFAQKTGAYVRLRTLSAYDGDPWTSLAEIKVLGAQAAANQPPNGVIDSPSGDVTITAGSSVNFAATATDPDGDPALTYLWTFGAGSGIADSTVPNPGSRQFNNVGTFTVTFTVTDSHGVSDPTPATRRVTVQSGTSTPISQSGWSLRSVDSQELVGENGAAVNAFDGNTNTFWHTEWKLTTAPQPHEIQINLGASYRIDGFRALARQDGGDNGRIRQFEFYVSTDGINWGSAVATGSLADNEFEQQVSFTAKTGNYVRLRSLSAYDGDPWTSLAELKVLGTPAASSPTPISQAGWSLRSVDSQELVGENGAAVNAFDGNTNTFWHTEWKLTTAPQPHEIQINLGASYQVVGFRALARQDGDDNGRIRQFEFYVSTDGVNWGSAVASGSLADNASEQEVLFTAKTGAYVRLRTLSAYDGDPWTSLAELKVLRTP